MTKPQDVKTVAAVAGNVGPQRSRGDASLSVASFDGRTRIGSLYQSGCAKLRVPASHAASGLEAVMINTSGGMTGGDRVDWHFDAGPQTCLTVTGQACEKVYKSAGGTAETRISLHARAGATLLWLPQETILFDGCAFRRRMSVTLDPDAQALLVEPMLFGRLAMGETVTRGHVRDSWRVWRGDHLLHAEEFAVDDKIGTVLAKAAVAGGHAAIATLLLVSPRAEALIQPTREILGDTGGASFWNGKLLARIVAADGYQMRKRLVPLIELLNPWAALPKVWAL